MIRRSNERLKMLDEMSRQRHIKLQNDLARLDAEKNAEKIRQKKMSENKAMFYYPEI